MYYDHYLHVAALPNDTKFSEQWVLHNTGQKNYTPDADVDAPEACDIETGSSDVVVAVVDTGNSSTKEIKRPLTWASTDVSWFSLD